MRDWLMITSRQLATDTDMKKTLQNFLKSFLGPWHSATVTRYE